MMSAKKQGKASGQSGRRTPFKSGSGKWFWLLVILLFASATRILYFLFFQGSDPFYSYLIHDAYRYHEWAMAILKGESWQPGSF